VSPFPLQAALVRPDEAARRHSAGIVRVVTVARSPTAMFQL
jgi:hypothetical protein